MAGNNELEKTLWAAADKLRSNMDAAEYKHVVLGLIFLKYISDAFNDLYDRLKEGKGENEGADPEDPDEYLSHNVFFVPEKARWQFLQDKAKQPEIGKMIDAAMDVIEKNNPPLKGVLPKIYADPELNEQRLGELIDLIGTIGFSQSGHKAKDLLGRVYEYFLGQFADAEGKKGGQFYTPASIVQLLVAMLEPYNGRVYDGCCGSGGMFVQSERFVEEHQGNIKDLSIFGQESNPTTLRLARMNLAIRGIDARIELGDTFLADKHKDLRADFILANPPFNVSDWSGEHLREDPRWKKYGVPPARDRKGTMHRAPTGRFRNRSNEILFIDARKLRTMVNRRNKELSDAHIALIADTYHAWRNLNGKYADKVGFSKSATIYEVKNNGYVLMPGRYVGTAEEADDGIPFDEKMKNLTAKLAEQFAKGNQLEKTIRESLKGIGYEL